MKSMAAKKTKVAPDAVEGVVAAETPAEALNVPAEQPAAKKSVPPSKKAAKKSVSPAKKAVRMKSADKKSAEKKAAGPAAKTTAPKAQKSAAVKAGKKSGVAADAKAAGKSKAKSDAKAGAKQQKKAKAEAAERATILSSEVIFEGPLFRILRDKLVEPGGKQNTRDVIRHNGSVVILALDASKSKKDPWVVVERQYRHAAGRFLWELPAGKLEAGEDALAGAQRELAEETGYQAKKWKPLVEYYASPGFLGESMKVFTAEGLIPGEAHPEGDEEIEFRLVKLSEVVKMIEKGLILDGKTMTSILLWVRRQAGKRRR
jgi:ADP-ribose pyrophosphatase